MARAVVKYSAKDGKEFESEELAEAHDHRLVVTEELAGFLKRNEVPLDGTQLVNLSFLLRAIHTKDGFAEGFCELVMRLARG